MSTELTQDWGSFQRVFYPKKRSKLPEAPTAYAAVVQGDKTLRILPTSDHFPTQGKTAEMRAHLPQNAKLKEVTVRDLEDALDRAMDGAGIFDQLDSIRESLKKTGTTLPGPKPHFLLQALTEGWWANLLPSAYGLLIGLERTQGRPKFYFLTVRKGKVSEFFIPDLTGLSEERANEPGEIVKYLTEKYTMKVQGVMVHADDWEAWATSSSPWKEVSSALRQDRLQFVPFRFRLAALVGSRGYLGI